VTQASRSHRKEARSRVTASKSSRVYIKDRSSKTELVVYAACAIEAGQARPDQARRLSLDTQRSRIHQSPHINSSSNLCYPICVFAQCCPDIACTTPKPDVLLYPNCSTRISGLDHQQTARYIRPHGSRQGISNMYERVYEEGHFLSGNADPDSAILYINTLLTPALTLIFQLKRRPVPTVI